MKTSLPKKIASIKPRESIVVFGDYRSLMKQIAVLKNRGYCQANIKYKKAKVIVDEELMIGVLITNEYISDPKE